MLLFSQVFFYASAQIQDNNQKKNRLEILNADIFTFQEINGRKVRKLIGNVHLRQDSTDMFCDSAYHYVDSNQVEAYSHVRIFMDGGKRFIKSDKATYSGNTKVARLYQNIVMRDSSITLSTNRLTYYRIQDYGKYENGGILSTGDNELHSNSGLYYPRENKSFFRGDVKLYNPDYTLESDTLGYNTETEVADFMAPTNVYDEVNSIHTEGGYYDTKEDKALFYQNASIGDTSYTIFADTIFYDKARDFGEAMVNVRILQNDTGLTVYGQYAEFLSKKEQSFITDSSFAVQIFDEDTLYLFADTLYVVPDTFPPDRHGFSNKGTDPLEDEDDMDDDDEFEFQGDDPVGLDSLASNDGENGVNVIPRRRMLPDFSPDETDEDSLDGEPKDPPPPVEEPDNDEPDDFEEDDDEPDDDGEDLEEDDDEPDDDFEEDDDDMDDDPLPALPGGDTPSSSSAEPDGQKADDGEKKRIFLGYHNVHFYMTGMQGKTDSLVYHYDDSLIFFFGDPVLWTEQTQITGKKMMIRLTGGKVDSMSIEKSGFIISEEDTVGYNQIKGKDIFVSFENNRIQKLWVNGNSESIYYAQDDDDEYFAMNEAKCSRMFMEFEGDKPEKIYFIDQPEGTLYPIHEVLFNPKQLEGFRWRIAERPVKPEGIFPVIEDSVLLARQDSLLRVQMKRDSLLRDSLLNTLPDSMQTATNVDSLFNALREQQEAAKDSVAGGKLGKPNARPEDSTTLPDRRFPTGKDSQKGFWNWLKGLFTKKAKVEEKPSRLNKDDTPAPPPNENGKSKPSRLGK